MTFGDIFKNAVKLGKFHPKSKKVRAITNIFRFKISYALSLSSKERHGSEQLTFI